MTETPPKHTGQGSFGVTPSATVGPYFKYGLAPGGAYPVRDAFSATVATPDAAGERIRIHGRITDGDGKPVVDAMIEIWQADAQGRYVHPRDTGPRANTSFKGFGRSDTDSAGAYTFDTIKPGKVAAAGGTMQAPHILVVLFARGMLRHLYTRIYFAEDSAAHSTDAVLALVPADRRHTLIAKRGGDGAYTFDIRIQGDGETVFFDL
jgi:protocatechuate 3,4-dioxygenase, alpha subunit